MNVKTKKASASLRAKLRSPGRPPVLHHVSRWRSGRRSHVGSAVRTQPPIAGVSMAVGARWFRQCGVMPSSLPAPSAPQTSGRYLSFAEREEITLARARGDGVREIVRQLGRAASTISRELRRNAATRGGKLEYRSHTAQWHADRVARRRKQVKLMSN